MWGGELGRGAERLVLPGMGADSGGHREGSPPPGRGRPPGKRQRSPSSRRRGETRAWHGWCLLRGLGERELGMEMWLVSVPRESRCAPVDEDGHRTFLAFTEQADSGSLGSDQEF